MQGGGGKKAWPSEELYETFRDAAESLRKLIDHVQKPLDFDPQAARPLAEAGLRLLAVSDGVAAAYEEEKRELAALDFNDLLLHARDLLRDANPAGSELRRRLAAQIHLLLVDEFQDTDPLQVELVRALCDGQVAGGKLFFVGDAKQSIYRFRGADPGVFERLRQEIPRQGPAAAVAQFPQPAGRAGVRQRLVLQGTEGARRELCAAAAVPHTSRPHAGRRVPLGHRGTR